MRFGSVCSGIEAASVAWHPLGWSAAFFSEIEPFPCAVLAHHYPDTPNHGDMTKFKEWPDAAIDVLVGGTPCQSFSVAGLRAGLDDPRGNLMLTFGAIADRYRPKWIVWENVPGVLSSNVGRDFGSFLGLLGQLGYGFAYRVLDAQFVRVDGLERAVPQRRRRVFVVGCLGDWRRAAAVLFDAESLSGNPAPRRKTGQGTTAHLEARAGGSGEAGSAGDGAGPADVTCTLNAAYCDKMGLEDQHALNGASMFVPDVMGTITARMFNALGARDVEEGALLAIDAYKQELTGDVSKPVSSRDDQDTASLVAHTLRGDGFDASEDGTGRGTPLVPIAFDTTQITSPDNRANPQPGDPCHTPQRGAHAPAIAFGVGMQVRRLTPRECARLQGFQDDYLDITFCGKPASDSAKYKALGNSMAVNCMRWIGARIQMVNAIEKAKAAA